MRIAMVIAGAGAGGMETHVRTLSAELAKRHEVFLLAHESIGRALPPGVRFLALNALEGCHRRNPFLARKLLKTLQGIAPDLVHAHGSKVATILSGRRFARYPLVATVHGIKRHLRFAKRFDRLIAVSPAAAARLPKEKTTVIPSLPTPLTVGRDTPHTFVFEHVSFRYPDAADNVLENISFTAEKGETVAFIGSTGSGKSTLVNLIPRFYDATEGEVLVDGVNVKEYKLEALNNKLGYVPQKAVMFSGTVSSNVAYGESSGNPQFSPEEVKRAVAIAQGTEFVEKMPDTYESPISQGGTNISGGQKQRLAIA
ncbi:MAG: ATP-binding cassette domain-containing protein, partial [Kiritimatiellia bacterium]